MHFSVLLCQSQQYIGISPVAETQLHRYNGTGPGFQQAAEGCDSLQPTFI